MFFPGEEWSASAGMSVYQKPRRGLVVVVCSVVEGRWVGVGRGGIGLERGGHGVPGEKVECNGAALKGSRFGGASADRGSFAVSSRTGRQNRRQLSRDRGRFDGSFCTQRQI